MVLLTLQALFALLEYRRKDSDPRMAIGLEWSVYLMAMLALAVPFQCRLPHHDATAPRIGVTSGMQMLPRRPLSPR